MNIYNIKVGDHVQISGERYLISHRIEQLYDEPVFRVALDSKMGISYGFALPIFFEEHFPKD
jgi:hypothetical protein